MIVVTQGEKQTNNQSAPQRQTSQCSRLPNVSTFLWNNFAVVFVLCVCFLFLFGFFDFHIWTLVADHEIVIALALFHYVRWFLMIILIALPVAHTLCVSWQSDDHFNKLCGNFKRVRILLSPCICRWSYQNALLLMLLLLFFFSSVVLYEAKIRIN